MVTILRDKVTPLRVHQPAYGHQPARSRGSDQICRNILGWVWAIRTAMAVSPREEIQVSQILRTWRVRTSLEKRTQRTWIQVRGTWRWCWKRLIETKETTCRQPRGKHRHQKATRGPLVPMTVKNQQVVRPHLPPWKVHTIDSKPQFASIEKVGMFPIRRED